MSTTDTDLISQLSSLKGPAPLTYTPPDTSGLDAQIGADKEKADAAEGELESDERKAGDLAEGTAKGLSKEDAAVNALYARYPSRQVAYGAGMSAAPIIAILSALGGKAAGISGVGMMGAMSGMMQGLNEGAEEKYQESLAKWKDELQQLKDRNAEQLEVYKLMLDAYSGRADAAQKARDYALAVTHDEMGAKQAAVKNSVDIFRAREQAIRQADKITALLEGYLLRAKQGAGTPETVETTAQLIAHYQLAPLTSFVMKTPWGQAVMSRVAQLNPAYDATQYNAKNKAASTAAGIAGKVAVAENEIKRFAPIVEQASAQVARQNFVPINKLLQMGQGSISDPHLKQLRIAINSLLNAYDMLAARGGTDKHKREEAHAMLTSADSPEALKAGIAMFLKEADAAEAAARDAVRGQSDVGRDFASEADAEAAAEAGQIKAGDRITVGGVAGVWQ